MIPAVMPTYGRWDVAVERGEGCYLYATDGRKFLDFTSGIAVTSLGHCHPHLIEAVTAQAQKLWHVSNLFQIPGQQKLAERLTANSFADTVFFNNSGAEAVELSIKVARKYQSETGHPERYRVIGCQGSFHGRSFATLAAAGAEGYLKGFGPVMDGFDHVAFNNLNEMRAAVTDQTAAILVEPVQGEGGVRAPSADYLKGLRAICDEYGLLLVYDEVQCGMGRTGKLFAHQWAGVTPDVMAVAKALGNGFPCAALLATEKASAALKLDLLGTTFGGGPMACAVMEAVIDAIESENLLERVRRVGSYIRQTCIVGPVTGHQGAGFLTGLRTTRPAKEIQAELLECGILAGTATDPHILRLLPPFILQEEQIDMLRDTLADLPA